MILTDYHKKFILNAPSKALATYFQKIHVIPVSTIYIQDEKIILCNYFMKQTIKNITNNPDVSLCCWSGDTGFQIKGSAAYKTRGQLFNTIKEDIIKQYPNRLLYGIIIITPQQLWNTSIKK